MSPLSLLLILSLVLASCELTETKDAQICYKKQKVDERTTKIMRTTCTVSEGDKQSEIKVFESRDDVSLTDLYKFSEDTSDSQKIVPFSEVEKGRAPCVEKRQTSYSGETTCVTQPPESSSTSNVSLNLLDDLPEEAFVDLYAFTFIEIHCHNATEDRLIYIGTRSNNNGSSGRIFFPSQNISAIYFVLKPGEGRFFQLPSRYRRPRKDYSGLLLNTTVVVAADELVVVYAYQGCRADYGGQASAFRVEEIKKLGTDYWVLTYNKALLGIFAVEENTWVTISFNHSGKTDEVQQYILLEKYDTYYLRLTFAATGTHITSNRKISVIVGVRYIRLPRESPNGEPFCETLEPVSRWGRSFSVAHFLGPEKSNDYIVKLMSAVNNNTVYWKEGMYTNETTLAKGESKELLITANFTDVLEITSTKDILVAQFATKVNTFTNPAMTLIPPHEYGTEGEIVFPVFDLTYEVNATNTLTVWVPPTGWASDLCLDNICTFHWEVLGTDNSGWRIFQTPLKGGSHILRIKEGLKVKAIVFASAIKRSFAHPVV